jgi:hypothetical protein
LMPNFAAHAASPISRHTFRTFRAFFLLTI